MSNVREFFSFLVLQAIYLHITSLVPSLVSSLIDTEQH